MGWKTIVKEILSHSKQVLPTEETRLWIILVLIRKHNDNYTFIQPLHTLFHFQHNDLKLPFNFIFLPTILFYFFNKNAGQPSFTLFRPSS